MQEKLTEIIECIWSWLKRPMGTCHMSDIAGSSCSEFYSGERAMKSYHLGSQLEL